MCLSKVSLVKLLSVGLIAIASLMLTISAQASEKVYGKFPVTLKGYSGSKTNSVSYTGQIARHVLHDSLKKLAAKGNGKPNPKLKSLMMSY